MPDWYPTIIHGDVEAAVVEILLLDTPELFNVVPFSNISTSMKGFTDGDRWIEVTLMGSSESTLIISRPRIDIEVRAETRSVCCDIANICLASVKRQMGNYRGFGLAITDVKVEQGITRIPDPYIEESRYTLALRLTVVPYGDPLLPSS